MAVKDFMTKRGVYVSPETTVAAAADIMRDKGLRRLPVIEHDKLVGLVTEGTMAEASPSKATSLSIYEMNYLLNKTKVGDIMIKNVLTVSKYASLEDAIYIMLQNKVESFQLWTMTKFQELSQIKMSFVLSWKFLVMVKRNSYWVGSS